MLTYTDQQNLAKEISNLSDATAVLNFKRDINAGTTRMLEKMSRQYNRQSRFTNAVAAQQYYQMPQDAVRVSDIIYLTGTNIWRPLIEVADETTWRLMNQTPQQSAMPTHFFVKGNDEFGIYPTPSANVTDGIELVFEPKHILLTADDYTTNTISVTNGSNVITGNTTLFTAMMASGGYILQVTDGNDGNYYNVATYSSATSITIDNVYQGITNATATYRIGQVSRLPEAYQEAPVDYAMFRHFLGKNEMDNAKYFQQLWSQSLEDLEDVYGNSTGSQIINASGNMRTFNPLTDITMNQIKV